MKGMVLGGAMALLVACGGSTAATPSPAPTTAYCADLARLQDDLDAAKADVGKTGGPNAYASAELRDAGPIYTDAATSRDPSAARLLSLALTLDGQARQQPDEDPAALSRIENDTVAAVRAAPSC